MPINTSSTGATYGKSSDPLCPLGFHPQVRWPTRCKRCFRDYKEHSDSGDQKKYSGLSKTVDDDDPWASRKSQFQKSKSVDVSLESGASARLASYSALNSASAVHSKTEEDIPEWKKAMLARRQEREKLQQKEDEESAAQKSRNFGFIPGTSLHSSYANKSYESDSRLSGWGSSSNLRSSGSYTNLADDADASSTTSSYRRKEQNNSASTSTNSWSRGGSSSFMPEKTETELSPYEKYLKRKKEQEMKDEEERRKSDEEKKEAERKKERERAREEERKREEEAERERARRREKEREQKRLEEEKREKEEEKKKAEQKEKTPLRKWESSSNKTTEAKTGSSTPKWGASAAAATKKVEEPAVKRKPWEKPSATAASKSTLPSLNESSGSRQNSFRKTSESDSENSLSTSASKTKTSSSRMTSSSTAAGHFSDSDHECSSKTEMEALKSEMKALKSRNDVLERMHSDKGGSNSLTLDSAKASEATAELLKAREKIREQETNLSSMNKEKKALNLKVKELESALERRPQASETQKTISELQTKLKFMENKCHDLTKENDDLRGNVQNLEVELEEVQDNFREDEADEYRSLKRELENTAKNCRVLQFKLKKAEKTLIDVTAEKSDLETKMKSISGGSSALENLNKIRNLEKELEAKSMHINRLEAEVRNAKSATNMSGPRRGGPGPCLSRTGSVERNVEDQLLKDLQDSIERENDLKEQLNMAEEESAEMRKKLSRLEDENESLSNQVKKMTLKNKSSRRSPSPYNKTSSIEKDEGISEDGEELTPAELKVQLEVSEGETALLRKKVENLLTENLRITKEVKDLNTKLGEEKKRKSTTSTSSYGSLASAKENSSSALEQKVSELQTEVSTFRVKLIEKDREIERLDAQVKANKGSGKTLKRSGSQDEDLLKKLNVIEKEAEVLRNKTAQLEAENESLKADKGKGSGYGSKYGSQGKLEMDKFALEEKVKSLENKLKESSKKIAELEDTGKSSMKTNLEVDRLKREKNSLEAEVTKLKDMGSTDKRKLDKLERDLAAAVDKAEKGQREIIAAEREKRKSEEERSKLESQISRLETDLRSSTKEKDRYREESEAARQKNRENLTQTQEGMKAFKDQIEILKMELGDEKRAGREMKRQADDKVRTADMELASLKREMDRKASDLEEKSRKVKDLEEKIADIDDKWSKSKRINQQRKEKIEKLESQLENSTSSYTNTLGLQNKLDSAEEKIKELEKELQEAKTSEVKSLEVSKLKREIDNLKAENKKLTSDMSKKNVDDDYATIKGELSTLRQTYNNKSDEWIKEKLELERQIKELEASIRSSAGNGWDVERNRYKAILDDRDSQITNLKIECDVARSQHSSVKKELEDVKQKLADYEKMNRYGKSANDSGSSDNSNQVEELKKQLNSEQKERKSDLNNVKMKYDSKIAIMTEELHALKSQASKYRRERETYKEMFEGVQKKLTDAKGGKVEAGDSTAVDLQEARNKLSDMSYQIHVLEDELSDAKMEAAKAHANMTALKSNYDIQISELSSKINEMEEESLIDSGRARIAGTRTKMELAWQKERESQKKLINELNTMARDLKNTLLEVEKEKERERLDSKRKIEAMKRAFDEEQDDTKKQITDLQYDLLELRDAHAKLRTTNEKLRRDKERSVDDVRMQSKSRSEHGEEKKVARLIKDMEDFMLTIPKFLGDDILEKEERGRTSRLDSEKSLAKMEFKTALLRVKETKEELEQIHKISEEEVRRRGMKRGESVETFDDSPARGRTGMRNASHSASSQKRALYRKAISVGDSIPEGNSNLWQSKESLGSNESMASNASIPLPIPVRTRSTRGGSESGYSSDTYNAMTIRRLERDTSVDRLSTGSKESTQSEWLPGEKKKSKGLLGKLKKIGRSLSTERTNEEREFGSGSDISSVSQASKASNTSKMSSASKILHRARSASKDRAAAATAEKVATVANANAAFDKYFDRSGGAAGGGAEGGASASRSTPSRPHSTVGAASASNRTSASSTLPRTYRRY